MSATGVGKLHLIIGTVNIFEHFREVIVSKIRKSENFIFQQDGAACHKPKKVLKWFSDDNISLLKWVSSSPDLSPIEALWHEMKKTVACKSSQNSRRTKRTIARNLG
nr:unnamed protein product [Callosobruchus analis]